MYQASALVVNYTETSLNFIYAVNKTFTNCFIWIKNKFGIHFFFRFNIYKWS